MQYVPVLDRLGAHGPQHSCSDVEAQVSNAGGCSLDGLTEMQMNLSICCDICDRKFFDRRKHFSLLVKKLSIDYDNVVYLQRSAALSLSPYLPSPPLPP